MRITKRRGEPYDKDTEHIRRVLNKTDIEIILLGKPTTVKRGVLEKVFDKYSNPVDYKLPFQANVVSAREADLLVAAIRFFHATDPSFLELTRWVRRNGKLVVQRYYNIHSNGYQAW